MMVWDNDVRCEVSEMGNGREEDDVRSVPAQSTTMAIDTATKYSVVYT